jgi:integrase
VLSLRTVTDVRLALRSALSVTVAVARSLIAKNLAARGVKLPKARKRRRKAWTSEQARRFLEHAKKAEDELYAAFVLTLVMGLRRGEVLGLVWDDLDLENGELTVDRQLQRVAGKLLHRRGTSLLNGHTRAGVRGRNTGSDLGGRYWDRTSDLLGVNEALSR